MTALEFYKNWYKGRDQINLNRLLDALYEDTAANSYLCKTAQSELEQLSKEEKDKLIAHAFQTILRVVSESHPDNMCILCLTTLSVTQNTPIKTEFLGPESYDNLLIFLKSVWATSKTLGFSLTTDLEMVQNNKMLYRGDGTIQNGEKYALIGQFIRLELIPPKL